MRAGFRYARNNPHLRATLIRGAAFFLFASAYWALLPLVAREQLAGGPELYGFLLGAIGAGAVAGAFVLPWLKSKLGPDRLVAAGSIGTAAAMALFGLASDAPSALAASVMAGASWIAVLSSLNVSAQVALPEWVRGRGLAMFVVVLFGSLSLGSAGLGAGGRDGRPLEGALHGRGMSSRGDSPDVALEAANGGGRGSYALHALAAAPRGAERRAGSRTGAGHGRIPDRSEKSRALSRRARKAEQGRRRDGAFRWGAYEDVAEEGRIVEVFLVESWLEHLRQHERVTNADRVVQDAVNRFHCEGAPKVTHLIASE